ncbi:MULTISPECIES: hypothetical protein [unclassified Methylobacterium]|uniref:hypothetical protein n=1 Tax=unclassified Methylobacterium TaxID=2615210 RepID=UPI0028BDE30E|nr:MULTISPECIES: hypothetical protein [unclassified Methylobacterium]
MVLADLDKRAELTVWPSGAPAQIARGQAFSTLREALVAAAESIQARRRAALDHH